MVDAITPETPQSILLVDDDERFRSVLAGAFRSRGFDVRVGGNYTDALESALADSPEMAVIDLKMPGRTGLELVQALKEIDPATMIVVLTGYGSIASAVNAVRLGATNYLPKPADVDDILAAFARGRSPALAPPRPDFKPPTLARAEWEHIQRVVADCGGNLTEAARLLGIHRRSLQRKLSKHAP